MAYLQLQQITKRFGDVQVVQEMNLNAALGEFIVLVGASGCGKSTTLRMIAGLEAPSSGQIIIDGRDVTAATPADRDIAMVFQNYALYPHMNVAQNMSFALELARAPKNVIEHLLERKPKALSGGQRQRVAMGRAIVREPKVFLFDEPLSNLDAKLRGQMRIEIAMLHRRLGKTTVYVTHDQVEAMTLADRIVVMDQGRIQQMGQPEEVFNRPLNRFVAGFIGSPTMNFLNAQVQERAGQPRLVGRGFDSPLPPQMAAAAQRWLGRALVLGIRPQTIALGENDSGLALKLKIHVCEYLGTESVLVGDLEGGQHSITVSAPGNQSPLLQQVVPAYVPLDRVFVFEPGDHGAAMYL